MKLPIASDRVFFVIEALCASALTFGAAWYTYNSVLLYPSPNYLGVAVLASFLGSIGIIAWYWMLRDIDAVVTNAYEMGWYKGILTRMEEPDEEA